MLRPRHRLLRVQLHQFFHKGHPNHQTAVSSLICLWLPSFVPDLLERLRLRPWAHLHLHCLLKQAFHLSRGHHRGQRYLLLPGQWALPLQLSSRPLQVVSHSQVINRCSQSNRRLRCLPHSSSLQLQQPTIGIAQASKLLLRRPQLLADIHLRLLPARKRRLLHPATPQLRLRNRKLSRRNVTRLRLNHPPLLLPADLRRFNHSLPGRAVL